MRVLVARRLRGRGRRLRLGWSRSGRSKGRRRSGSRLGLASVSRGALLRLVRLLRLAGWTSMSSTGASASATVTAAASSKVATGSAIVQLGSTSGHALVGATTTSPSSTEGRSAASGTGLTRLGVETVLVAATSPVSTSSSSRNRSTLLHLRLLGRRLLGEERRLRVCRRMLLREGSVVEAASARETTRGDLG